MLAGFNLDNDMSLDAMMEQTLGELDPLPSMEDNNMDDIFEDCLSYMPEMETEMISFKDIVGEDDPDELKVDELYSQLEALFGNISLNQEKCAVKDNIEELDNTVNESLKLKTEPILAK